MINLYVKFNVHSSYAKQVIVLKVVDRRTDGRTPESILVQYFISGVISEMWVDQVVQDILGGNTFWWPHIYERREYSCAIFYFGGDFWKCGVTRWYMIYLGLVPFGHPTYMNEFTSDDWRGGGG